MFEFKYSTVQEFYHAVRSELSENKIELQLVHDDFFPLEQIYKDSFWTGYYTSRPGFKSAIRAFSRYTNIANKLISL